MRWQDIVISIAQLCFVIAMIPSIRSNDKPALATSVMNVCLVTVIVICLFSLQLWFSAVSAVAVALAWGILAIQKLKPNKSSKLSVAKRND